ncbi:MAG: flagellin FliC [Gammaproteobacteria bacterium]|nr:flagellin FliC [Gammaproteobacteria bacterium]
MAQVINTNVASLGAQRYLSNSQNSLQTSLQRLSSGLRINTAKDDAAGLSISEGLTKQIRGYSQGTRNANDAISMMQTAEGGLQEISNMLQRVRELAVQSANGNYTSVERTAMNDEVGQLVSEIGRVAGNLTFNGTKVIGSAVSIKFQVGQAAGDQVTVALTNASGVAAGANVSTATTAGSTISKMDTAINTINAQRGALGAAMNRMESVVRTNENVVENLSASRSRILDADFAAETANLTRNQILQQAGSAMLAQANSLPQNVLALLS